MKYKQKHSTESEKRLIHKKNLERSETGPSDERKHGIDRPEPKPLSQEELELDDRLYTELLDHWTFTNDQCQKARDLTYKHKKERSYRTPDYDEERFVFDTLWHGIQDELHFYAREFNRLNVGSATGRADLKKRFAMLNTLQPFVQEHLQSAKEHIRERRLDAEYRIFRPPLSENERPIVPPSPLDPGDVPFGGDGEYEPPPPYEPKNPFTSSESPFDS